MKYELNKNCMIKNSTTVSRAYELCLDIDDIDDDVPVLNALNLHDELVHAAWFAKMAFTPLDDMLTDAEREQHDNFWMEQHDNAVDREEHPSADKVREYALERLTAVLAKVEGK